MGSASASPSAACCAASYAVRSAARYAFPWSRIESRTARAPAFFEEFRRLRRGRRPWSARRRQSGMTTADVRVEVPELAVDNGEPVVQEWEAAFVEVGVPPDLETARGGLVQVEMSRKFSSQPFSPISVDVASARQQTNIPGLAGRQCRSQDPCSHCVEMGVEDQDANERLHDRRLERDQFQDSSGSARRMSPVDLFAGRKTEKVLVFQGVPISDRGPQQPWTDRRLGKSSSRGFVVDDGGR